MTALNNVLPLAVFFPQFQTQGARSDIDSGNSDGFAATFRQAAEASRGSPESIQGANPQSGQDAPVVSAQEPTASTPLTEPHEDEPTEDVPDELLALVASVMQPITADQPIEQEIDTNTITDTDSTYVVSGLESNKEIEAPADNAPATGQEFILPAEATVTEHMARMPQPSGQTEIPEEDATAKTESAKPTAAQADTGAPCPLENENNKAVNHDDAQPNHDEKREKSQTEPETRVFGQAQTVDISPERLHASEQLSQTAESTPQTATVETLYDKLVDSIFTASTTDSKFMELQLKPEFLGKVAVQLTLGDAGLEIRIKAEDVGVKGLIADQITQLTTSLNDKGVKVSAVEVVFANATDHSYDGSGSHQQDAHRAARTNSSRSTNIGFGIGFTEDEDSVSIVDTGISSVEYSV